MQCVGTLSWNGMGLASPTSNKSLSPGPWPGHCGVPWKRRDWRSKGACRRSYAGGKTMAPDAASRTRVNPLEIDWSRSSNAAWTGIPAHGLSWSGRTIGVSTGSVTLYRQPGRRRGPDPGRLPEGLLESGQLRHSARQPAGLDHNHDPQPAGGQLPADPQPARDRLIR